MQSLSIIGHPGGGHKVAQQLLAQGPFQTLQCVNLDREQVLQGTLAGSDHTLLVYCPPGLALARALEQDSEADCDQALQNWSDNARTLLRHFMLNRQQCTLVNELTLLHAPSKVLAVLATKTGQSIATDTPQNNQQTVQPLFEALGTSLAYTDQRSNGLYHDLEAVADVSGEAVIQQQQINLKSVLQQENSATLQELREEKKRLLQQQHQTQEALEQSLSEKNKLSEEISKLSQNKRVTNSAELAEKTKELQEENELLLLQLHQVQEELEHYFCEYQKLTDPTSRHHGGGAQLSTPSVGLALETLFDLRDEQIIGNNWYDAEADGRWAGPGTTSTLNLPVPGEGPFELVFDIVHALDASIVKHMQIMLNGEPLTLRHKFGKLPIKRFPCQVKAQVPQSNNAQPSTWQVELRFPKTVSPADKGSDDHRQLAIRLKSIRARALVTPHKG